MLALTYTGSKWSRVSSKSCELKRAKHQNTWNAQAARIKAKGGAQLRDVAALVNHCLDPQAYQFCAKAYKIHIQASLGGNPDIRLVARQPLFSLLNAPELAADACPLFADTPNHQAYIVTDWFQRDRKDRRLLICATSRTHTLSMPLQVFQAYARQHFDGIAYLFDTSRNHYQDCLESTADCVDLMIKSLEPGTVGFLGTSAGACMAIQLCQQHEQAKAVAGSPVLDMFPELTRQLESTPSEQLHRYLRITYGDNAIDSHYKTCFDRLSAEESARVAINMSHINPTHASLGVTTLNGMFNELLEWLASSRDSDQQAT